MIFFNRNFTYLKDALSQILSYLFPSNLSLDTIHSIHDTQYDTRKAFSILQLCKCTAIGTEAQTNIDQIKFVLLHSNELYS